MSFPCKFCGAVSTIHLTDVIGKKKREMHLCEACAREKKIIPTNPQEINVPALLELVLGVSQVPQAVPPTETTCPDCGFQYAQFRKIGRFGCPHDYIVFKELIEPVLERVHNDSRQHLGKIPKRHQRRLKLARRVELQAQLRTAIATERYEVAAQLRDAIRVLENELES